MRHIRFLLRWRGFTDVCPEHGPLGFFIRIGWCPRCTGAATAAAGYGGA